MVLFGTFSLGINMARAYSCSSIATGLYSASSSWSGCNSTTPQITDTITINNGNTITIGAAVTVAGVTIATGGTLTTNASYLLTDTGNYINNGTDSGTGGVTVSGATSTIGGTGVTTNTGTFTISGATSPSFSSTSTLSITGQLTITGPLTITSGATITELGTTAISGVGTVTNNGTFNANGASGITGVASTTWTQGANATLNFGGGTTTLLATGTLNATSTGNTVNYNEANAQTCKVTQYYNLTLGGTSAKTCNLTSNVLGNVVVGGTATWLQAATTTINGMLTVSGGTITTAAYTFTVTGTTSILAGTVTLTSNTSTKTFAGMVTLTGGTLAGLSTNIVTTAGITNNGGAVTITGTDTFGTAGATLSGSSAIAIASVTVTSPGTLANSGSLTLSGTLSGTGTVTNSGTITVVTVTLTSPGAVTNNSTVTISGVLSGTGSWTQGTGSTLNLSDAATTIVSITAFNVSSTVNTVNYSGAAQTCDVVQYYNLTLSGSSTKTCALTSNILGNLVYSGTGAWALTTAFGVNGSLTVSGSGGTITTGGIAFTVSGTTSISNGSLILNTSAGAKTLTGMVTLSGGTLSGSATSTIFGAGITNNGGTVLITGSSTFATAGATLSGSSLITLAYVAVTTPGTVTNNGTTTLSGILSGTGSWTQGTGSTLTLSLTGTPISSGITFNASTNANTINYSGAAQTCFTTQYYNLTLSGSAAKTCAPTSPTLGNVVMSGTATWAQTATEVINGNLTLGGTSLTTAAYAFTVSGTTSITAGTLSLASSAGVQTFTGMVTLNGSNPTLSGAATSTVFGAGITNASGTVSLTGSSTFATAGATLSGADFITMAAVIVTGSVTNNGTTTITGILSGTGSWTQGSGSTLTLSGGGSVATISTLNASTNVNAVNYTGAAPTCLATQYYNLTFGGSGAVACAVTSVLGNLLYNGTAAGTWPMTTGLTVNGNMTVSSTAAATITLGGVTTISGNLTINAGTTLDTKAANSYALNLNGSFTNNGTFTARAGTVTLGGTNTQSLSGTMTGGSAFYNLTITNISGTHPSDCEITGFTPGVIFLAGASSTNAFTITTGGVNVEYNNGSAYSFLNTDWVGPVGYPIYFRNSVAGSGTWLLNVSGSGTQVPLAYVNVSRSNASGGATINAANITNNDCGNNTNWLFGASSTSPTAYSQEAYKWFGNPNSLQVGSALAVQNASTTLTITGETFRLRMLLAVDASSSVAGANSFVLQFANKGTGTSCSAPQYGYVNVTTSTAIAYNVNSSVPNGSAMASTSTDPVDGGRVVYPQTYQSGGLFGITRTIPVGSDGDWDFSLIDNGSPGGTDYCFQAMFASTTPLYAYGVYPEIITLPTPFPVISTMLFNGGNANIILTPNTTTPITAVASISDPSGPGNILSATSTIYRTSFGPSCTSNNSNCYQIPNSSCTFSNNTSTVTCTAGLWYFAQSTGNASSSFPSDSWTSAITVKDGGGYTTTATSSVANVNVLTAINLSTSSINYGLLIPNTNTGSTNQAVVVQNAGNSSTTLQISGSAFMSGGNIIATSSQHYATSNFTFGAFAGSEQQLSDSLTTVPGFLLTNPTSTSTVQGNIFWGDSIPSGSPKGTYTATTTFSAVFSQ